MPDPTLQPLQPKEGTEGGTRANPGWLSSRALEGLLLSGWAKWHFLFQRREAYCGDVYSSLAPAGGRGKYKLSHGMQLNFLLKCKLGLKILGMCFWAQLVS